MELYNTISNDIKEAMKAQDKVALATLRNIKKVLLEAKTAPGANDTVSDEDAIKIIQKLVKQGRESAQLYESQNRNDLAQEELAQVSVMEKYLPKPLSDEEINQAVKEIIAELGVTSMQEMGKVMGVASKRLAGKADGRTISTIVKSLLS
ncbi:MAG: GatB/YqeY domain-containing protein [Bacteroidaceae bacterium]|nr:GatB/YqeY domain-containing protein [Bacteroidaceae bacterium]